MGIHIYCDKKDILDIKNVIFDIIHKSILSIIDKENLQITRNIQDMLENMDQDIYGLGAIWVDIADFIKTKEELLLFADLVKQAIEREHQERTFIPEALERLWHFHQEILKYGEKLK